MNKSEQINKLNEQLAETLREIEKLNALPDEPTVGSVVKFTKRYSKFGPRYNYAAIRTSAGWFLTGTGRANAQTWSEILTVAGDVEVLGSTGFRTIQQGQSESELFVDMGAGWIADGDTITFDALPRYTISGG